MKYLSDQLIKANEDYLTIPAIRKFAKANKIKNISDCDRPELLNELEKFADGSEDNAIILQEWFENVLAEGIKTVHMIKSLNLKEIYEVNKRLRIYSKILLNGKNDYVNNIGANRTLSLYRMKEYDSELGKIVRFSFVKKVSYLKEVNERLQTINLPVQIVLLLDHNLILIQFKSKSGIYEFASSREELRDRLTDDKLANECINYIINTLKLNYANNLLNKNTLYNLLTRFTKTPAVIKTRIEELKDQLAYMTDLVCDDLCKVSERNKQDVLWDLTNIVEKYISINVEDKSIFTEDRDAYPIKLISSDEEDSRVEQCSGNVEPLQTKSIFYDNKKMMQKSQQCDGIYLKFHRIDETYFNNDVDVHIQVKTKYMIIKFTKYTMQEDMENVLKSIISAQPKIRNVE